MKIIINIDDSDDESIKELFKKENENRAVLFIGLLIIILVISGLIINSVIDKMITLREFDYSEVNACQKGCNDMANKLSEKLNDSVYVFSCLEFCNKYYYEEKEK